MPILFEFLLKICLDVISSFTGYRDFDCRLQKGVATLIYSSYCLLEEDYSSLGVVWMWWKRQYRIFLSNVKYTWSYQISYKTNVQYCTFPSFNYPPDYADFLNERTSFLLREYKTLSGNEWCHGVNTISPLYAVLSHYMAKKIIKYYTRFFCLRNKTRFLTDICIHYAIQTYSSGKSNRLTRGWNWTCIMKANNIFPKTKLLLY